MIERRGDYGAVSCSRPFSFRPKIMAIRTTTQQLEAVQAAIIKCEAGQSYTIDGVTFTKANIDTLYKREERLIARLASEDGTSPMASYANVGGNE